jgi:hypothetical protein
MRPVDALICGFAKSPELAEESLAPLLQLKQEQVIRDIRYVTWDSPELDSFVAPIAAMPEVLTTRVPQPQAAGNAKQRGLIYQVRNLEAALALVPGNDGLVLKTRPDFVADAGFLRRKIANFARDCAVPERRSQQGVEMPRPVLENKIWIPWADSNQPFFFEDATFMGTARDVRKLVTPLTAKDMAIMEDLDCGGYAHVVRYARLFTDSWPIFRNYLRHYRCFPNNFDYRMKLVQFMLAEGFFWHLVIAHAWILHSQFHVDIGAPLELCFYPNNINQQADWSRPESLKLANPYDDSANWRIGTMPGEAAESVRRAYARLMDDAWQTQLFTAEMPDLPRETLRDIMQNVAAGDGRLGGIERDYYQKLESFHRANWPVAG